MVSVTGPNKDKIAALADERNIKHFGDNLEDCVSSQNVDAVILSTPTQMHADQAINVYGCRQTCSRGNSNG